MAKYRIWCVPVHNATPLAGRPLRWRVVSAYRDFEQWATGVTVAKNMKANGKEFDKVLCFHASRFIRIGAFCNPKKEIFNRQ